MTPNDPLYPEQWHFSLLGDIETVWDEYTGKDVELVAVYDDGVEYTHPDLAPNYDERLHFRYRGETFDPKPITDRDDHGTAVAGLIAAAGNNGIGGLGVAFDATFSGVNLLDDPTIGLYRGGGWLKALDYAGQFDIMSNSWGAPAPDGPDFSSDWSVLVPDSLDARTVAAYADITVDGRGGLGTVILQAAGNEESNSNGEGKLASRYTVAVAATGRDGDAAWYTNYGANILVTAPAAAVTTTTGGEYTYSFNGTSAATPVTAGVVALMLDAEPDLGWRDVHDILALSASQTGSALGEPKRGDEVQPWFSTNAENWNGGGVTFNASYGYGMVDAFAAVRMAEAWSRMTDGPRTSRNEASTTATFGGEPVRVRDDGSATVSLEVTENLEIENVAVTIGYEASWLGDLALVLVSPDGSEVPLLFPSDVPSSFEGERFDWRFNATALRGLDSEGTWKLVVSDTTAKADGGVLDALSIEIFGRPASRDDIYHFTDDFPTLRAAEAGRRRIADTDGGEDWLNLAAVSGNVGLDMSPGGLLKVDGERWTRLKEGPFENAVSGDGDDAIDGNGRANELAGMRGDDMLRGRKGPDELDGFRGRDVLIGNKGRDTLEGGAGRDRLDGQRGSDELTGGGGNDTVSGGKRDDLLSGGKGADRLDGGHGDDTMSGGAGADVFVVGPRAGDDVVTDFSPGTDLLDMTALDIAFDDLAIRSVERGASTRVLHPDGALLLRGVDRADIGPDSFLFAAAAASAEDAIL